MRVVIVKSHGRRDGASQTALNIHHERVYKREAATARTSPQLGLCR